MAVVSWRLALSSRKGNKGAYKTGGERERERAREGGKWDRGNQLCLFSFHFYKFFQESFHFLSL